MQVEKTAILQALDNNGGNQGRAAEALGISRRTLIRKLKTYREAGAENPSGTLSMNQQRYYRAQTRAADPNEICRRSSWKRTLLNISAGGAGVKTEKPLKSGAPVALVFTVPGSQELMRNSPGALPGPTKAGNTESSSADLPASLRTTLQRWLRAEMKKDGLERSRLSYNHLIVPLICAPDRFNRR